MKELYFQRTLSHGNRIHAETLETLLCVVNDENAEKLKDIIQDEVNRLFNRHVEYVKSLKVLAEKYIETKDIKLKNLINYDSNIVKSFKDDCKFIKACQFSLVVRSWFPVDLISLYNKDDLINSLLTGVNSNSRDFNPTIIIKDVKYFTSEDI